MRRSANRFDAGDPDQHARVAHAAQYDIEVPLYHRKVGNGHIHCRMLKSHTAGAKRIVQLVAEYSDAGVDVQHVVQCESEVDEVKQLERLEKLIRAASRRPALR